MIIFQLGNNFWIEYHETTIAAVAAGANGRFDIPTDRGGRFVGLAAGGGQASLLNGTPVGTLNGDLANLVFGVELTGIGAQTLSIFMRNGGVGAEDQLFKVVVFMRGTGH